MQVGNILSSHVLQMELSGSGVPIVLVVLLLAPIYASDFAQSGTIYSGDATLPRGSGGACS